MFVHDGERCWIVRLPDIYLLESESNYTPVYFRNERPLIRRSLNVLETQLALRPVTAWLLRSILFELRPGFLLVLRVKGASKFLSGYIYLTQAGSLRILIRHALKNALSWKIR